MLSSVQTNHYNHLWKFGTSISYQEMPSLNFIWHSHYIGQGLFSNIYHKFSQSGMLSSECQPRYSPVSTVLMIVASGVCELIWKAELSCTTLCPWSASTSTSKMNNGLCLLFQKIKQSHQKIHLQYHLCQLCSWQLLAVFARSVEK